MYSKQQQKPFMLAEGGAAFHLLPTPPGPGELPIKQTWWRQYLNVTFLTSFPLFKAVCFFEFLKPEGTSYRDFRVTPIEK